MQYKGLEIHFVQTANPTGFKWTVHLDATRVRTGDSYSRVAAFHDAEHVIDKAVKSKSKGAVVPPRY